MNPTQQLMREFATAALFKDYNLRDKQSIPQSIIIDFKKVMGEGKMLNYVFEKLQTQYKAMKDTNIFEVENIMMHHPELIYGMYVKEKTDTRTIFTNPKTYDMTLPIFKDGIQSIISYDEGFGFSLFSDGRRVSRVCVADDKGDVEYSVNVTKSGLRIHLLLYMREPSFYSLLENHLNENGFFERMER